MKNPGVYILTNRINGKQYVGLDSNLPRRIKEHMRGNVKGCNAIFKAIEKYGSENFEVEIIQYPNISREALCEVEKLKIKQLNTIAPNGYNLTTGGQGWIPTEAINQKRSKSLKGKPKSKEHRQALSEARQGFRFRMTEKHKRNMARNGSSNGSFRKDLNRTEICQRYLLGESAKELAKAFDAGETTIYRILRKHNIERRSSAETQRLQNARK